MAKRIRNKPHADSVLSDAKDEAAGRLERIRGEWENLRTIAVDDMDWLMSDAVTIRPAEWRPRVRLLPPPLISLIPPWIRDDE